MLVAVNGVLIDLAVIAGLLVFTVAMCIVDDRNRYKGP